MFGIFVAIYCNLATYNKPIGQSLKTLRARESIYTLVEPHRLFVV